MNGMSEDLRGLVSKVLCIEPAELDDAQTMDEIESWDSLTHLELVIAVEDRFGIALTPEERMEMTSVPRIAYFLSEKGVR